MCSKPTIALLVQSVKYAQGQYAQLLVLNR